MGVACRAFDCRCPCSAILPLDLDHGLVFGTGEWMQPAAGACIDCPLGHRSPIAFDFADGVRGGIALGLFRERGRPQVAGHAPSIEHTHRCFGSLHQRGCAFGSSFSDKMDASSMNFGGKSKE